ncbi:MAG: type III pantothenate kinase, partial [Clostridiales bacterium]|nr:type III pantothenate kinase [Clostridiales bacterium]
MGTATTISVINDKKALIGGLIMPGVALSLEALTSKTALLPDIDLEAPKNVIGKNTVDCIKSGVVLGAAAMIDGTIERIEQELGSEATLVATGGIAGFITPNCKHDIKIDNNLLLEGLEIIYNKNRNEK